MHNPVNSAIAFFLLVATVGGSFYYVYALSPRGPWIGVLQGGFINPEIAQALGLGENHGFLIMSIASPSPAEKAGLQQADHQTELSGREIPTGGDIILSMDGKQINGIDDLCGVLGQKEVGDNVGIEINRDGKLVDVNIVLEEAPPGSSAEC